MFKIKILLIVLISLILLNNCGFTPRYAANKDINFSIKIGNFSGDRDFNNLIKSKLNSYSKKQNKTYSDHFNVNFDSKYKKKITARDGGGVATDYELEMIVNFVIESDKTKKKIIMKETFNMKKMNDSFEEDNYEKTIKTNFADLIIERLIFQISLMQ